MAALLRGNFGSLVDFAKNVTKIHAVLLPNCLPVSGFLLGHFYTKISGFVAKFPKKNYASTKIHLFCLQGTLLENF